MSNSLGDSMRAVGGAVVTGAKQGAGFVAGREIVSIAKEAIPGLGGYLNMMPEAAQVLLAATLVRGLAPHLPQGDFIAAAAEGACAASSVMLVQTIRPDLVKRLGNVGRRYKGEPIEGDDGAAAALAAVAAQAQAQGDMVAQMKAMMAQQAADAAAREERLLALLAGAKSG